MSDVVEKIDPLKKAKRILFLRKEVGASVKGALEEYTVYCKCWGEYIAQALLDCEARCEALGAALENEDTSKCEGCEAPAVTADSEGVPLCQVCYDDLKPITPPADDKQMENKDG